MKEITGNLWDYYLIKDTAVVITTNGFVKNNGECVMGRGCAKEAADRIPYLAKNLGYLITTKGNHVHLLGEKLYSFPVKHNWWEKADLELIKQSCEELTKLVKENRVILPRPGCGNGKLLWAQVKPVIEKILDDRFNIITFAERSSF